MTPRTAAAAAALAALAALPAGAEDSLRARIDALRSAQAPLVTGDLYAEDKARDKDRIAARSAALFPEGEPIALFIGPDCPECAEARETLLALGHPVALHDTREPEAAALMAQMTLDSLPSYVMPGRLIRGAMPGFVLQRYLEE